MGSDVLLKDGFEVANQKCLKFGGFLNMHVSVFQAVGNCSRCGKCYHLIVDATITICLGATAACERIVKLNLLICTKKRFALKEGVGEVLFHVRVCNAEFNEAGGV